MRVWRRLSRIALVCLILCPLSAAATASDRAAAERVLGPQWEQLAQRAGMIFTATVLNSGSAVEPAGALSNLRQGEDFVEFKFRIDRPIAGVQRGQILAIREWTGALSRQPALRSGERVLLFLYPPSRLGLTSPVGGARGQIRLDSTGQSIAGPSIVGPSMAGPSIAVRSIAEPASPAESKSQGEHDQDSPAVANASASHERIRVSQLERALRAARGE